MTEKTKLVEEFVSDIDRLIREYAKRAVAEDTRSPLLRGFTNALAGVCDMADDILNNVIKN